MARRGALGRLRRHRVPSWWLDAKLGIFIHWTMAAVPAFAPIGVEFKDLLKSEQREAYSLSPYVEWYENSLKFPNSPVARYHREHFGDRPYTDFRDGFEEGIAAFDPDAWVAPIAASGARYVVLVAKHSDGFCLWPTSVENPHRPGWHSRRDVVGELAEAVRGAGLRFGLYYSGGLDWTFNGRPIGSMGDVIAAIPRGDYPAYAEAQVRELITRYRPSVLWNDIAWPQPGPDLWRLFADYYDAVPDGVVNDRWLPMSRLLSALASAPGRRLVDAVTLRQMRRDGGLIPPPPPHFDYRTPEYVVFPDVPRHPWECVRGMDESFGYNAASRPEDFIARDDLEWLLTDIVAKGGNLLINIGPKGRDASIPTEQLDRLGWLGQWTSERSDSIHETRPWVAPGTTTSEGRPVRYVTAGDAIFATIDRPGPISTLAELDVGPATAVTRLDGPEPRWRASPTGLVVEFPDDSARWATLRFDGAMARARVAPESPASSR